MRLFIKKNPVLVQSIKYVGISVLAVLIALLSVIPLGSAVIVKNGEFTVNMALGERVIYEGKPIEVVASLMNSSSQVQLIDFEGACQATFVIRDLEGKIVFPRIAEETPCNNAGYEKFLIYPGQRKDYKFVVPGDENAPVLFKGKYNVTAEIIGFGRTNSISLEVVKKPDIFAKEFDLCEGLTARICGPGLACKHRGGFQDGAGICLATTNNFEPENRCRSGQSGCFNDTQGHQFEEIIEKYALMKHVQGFENSTFKPDEPIHPKDFAALVSKLSDKNVVIKTNDDFVQLDTTIAVLYKAYISEKAPRTLKGSPFVDINNSNKREYIDAAFNLGLISSNDTNRFEPFSKLSRARALAFIDKFENYGR